MSHFTTLEVSFQQSEEANLIRALESIFGEGSVEVHEEPTGLFGYEGNDRSLLPATDPNHAPKAHLVVRREHLGPACNDIGFVRTAEGGYQALVSSYDRLVIFRPERQGMLLQNYALSVAERKLRLQGYTVRRESATDGTVKLIATKW